MMDLFNTGALIGAAGGAKCLGEIDQKSNLNETIAWLAISTAILQLLSLPNAYKSLVLMCRQEEKNSRKVVNLLTIPLLPLKLALTLVFALQLWFYFQNKTLINILESTHIILLLQLISMFFNFTTGLLTFSIIVSFQCCSVWIALLSVGKSAVPISLAEQVLVSVEYFLVYALVPSALLIRYNFSLQRLYTQWQSKILGFWLFFQIHWTLFQGLAIVTHVNLNLMLCAPPLLQSSLALLILPDLVRFPSYRTPVLLIAAAAGYAALQWAVIGLERLLETVVTKHRIFDKKQ